MLYRGLGYTSATSTRILEENRPCPDWLGETSLKNRKSAFITAFNAQSGGPSCAGQDAVTGQNFAHRKAWIQQRLEFLAGQFGSEVLSFAVMSNHLHVVLRNRPDVVPEWSDQEVARRWWFLFPGRKDAAGQPEEPTAADLQMLTADEERLAERRRRLSSLGLRRGQTCFPVLEVPSNSARWIWRR